MEINYLAVKHRLTWRAAGEGMQLCDGPVTAVHNRFPAQVPVLSVATRLPAPADGALLAPAAIMRPR